MDLLFIYILKTADACVPNIILVLDKLKSIE